MIRVVVLNKWKTIGKHTVERDRKWKYYTVNYKDSLQFASLSHEPFKSPLLLHPGLGTMVWIHHCYVVAMVVVGWDILSVQGE